MKTLEIIHLRLAGSSPQCLVDIIREAIGPLGDQLDIRFYHNPKLTNDFAVHIHRMADASGERAGNVGLKIAALLKDFGMVSHSVWTECCSLDNSSRPDETFEKQGGV